MSMINKKMIINVENLGVQYSESQWGIRNINVSFREGEFIALVGANGAGKSTFINTLCGIMQPTTGDIIYHADFIDNNNPFSNIGWSKQSQSIDWYLNVYDNVILGAKLAGFRKKKAHTLTMKALQLVGLEDLAQKEVDALSGGQQQRVQIARALVHEPKILILDEPTTGMDAGSAEKLLEYLAGKSKSGSIVIVSSHDLSLVESYCDKVLFLSNGELLTMEDKETFLSRYSDKELLTIEYEGDLTEDTLEEIMQHSIKLREIQPLQLEIKRNLSVGPIIKILDNHVQVLDLKRSSPGLREAYLSITSSDKGGEPYEN